MTQIIHLEVLQNLDQMREPEEFTWDIPFVTKTLHLDRNGLPKIGTHIKPGMVIVGKLGKTKDFNPAKIHSCLEILTSRKKLRKMYNCMLYNASLYATEKTSGIVKSAYFDYTSNNRLKAIIEIEANNQT